MTDQGIQLPAISLRCPYCQEINHLGQGDITMTCSNCKQIFFRPIRLPEEQPTRDEIYRINEYERK